MIRRWKKEYNIGKEAFTGKGIPCLTSEQKERAKLEERLNKIEVLLMNGDNE